MPANEFAEADKVLGAVSGETSEDAIVLHFDIRYAVGQAHEQIIERIQAQAEAAGGRIVDILNDDPYYVQADDPRVQLLTATYNDVLGCEARPVAVGDGTHARFIPRALNFGPEFHADHVPAADGIDLETPPFIAPGAGNAHGADPAKQPSESHWANLRDTQSKTLALPHTGQAVIIDIGEENDIHPRNKQDVGKRLALHALHNDYGYNSIVCTGPIFQSVKRIGDALEVTFNACDEQLVARNKYGYLSGFAIAGADGKYQWAQAKIENNKVIVWNKEIQQPVSVRYAWGDNPDDANLYNAAGLPASPFEGHIRRISPR